MIKEVSNKIIVFVLLSVLLILLLVLAFLSPGAYGGADNIQHYFISRYAFHHPRLFLDHWGKPVFTLLSAPFSQFGFMGLKLFNVIAGLGTAFFSFKLLKKLGSPNAPLGILFVALAPLYFIMMLTGLTEILFSFVLVLAVYLFFSKRFTWSAVVISFILLVRTEGVMFLPIFLAAFLVNRSWKAVPFLLTGALLYSMAGWLWVYHDFLWLLHQNPYQGAKGIYGCGSLFTFIGATFYTLGIPLALFFMLGLAAWIRQWKGRDQQARRLIINKVVLVFLPLAAYYAAHSFLWWQGLGGSLGLVRVVAGVLPLASVTAVEGFGFLAGFLEKRLWQRVSLLIISVIVIAWTTFTVNRYPVRLSETEKQVKETVDWLSHSEYSKKKVFYYDPYVCFFLGLDPFSGERCQQMIHIAALDENDVETNSVLVWDAHFGPNEGGMPLDRIRGSERFRLLKVFRPATPFNVMNNHDYETDVFLKLPRNLEGYALLPDSVKSQDEKPYQVWILQDLDFETPRDAKDPAGISNSKSHSGKNSFKMGGDLEYGPGFSELISDITAKRDGLKIKLEACVLPVIPLKENPLSLVLTLERDHKTLVYKSLDLENEGLATGRWNLAGFTEALPAVKASDKLTIYLWHRGKKEIFVDDFKIKLLD